MIKFTDTDESTIRQIFYWLARALTVRRESDILGICNDSTNSGSLLSTSLHNRMPTFFATPWVNSLTNKYQRMLAYTQGFMRTKISAIFFLNFNLYVLIKLYYPISFILFPLELQFRNFISINFRSENIFICINYYRRNIGRTAGRIKWILMEVYAKGSDEAEVWHTYSPWISSMWRPARSAQVRVGAPVSSE